MIGDKIKELRIEKGIYQQELANALSVSKSTVAMWETNRRIPDIDTLNKISDYFNVSVDWITGKSVFKNHSEIGQYYKYWNTSNDCFDPPFDFCKLLLVIRTEQSISINKMADALNMTDQQYQDCEDGISPITYEQAEKLCEILNTNVSQVLFESGHYHETVPMEYFDNVREWENLKIHNEQLKSSEHETTNLSTSNDDSLEIINRNAKKLSPEKQKQLLDVARILFQEEFNE